MDIITTTQILLLISAFLGVVIGLYRFFTKMKNATVGENVVVEMNNSLLKNLKEEIERLKGIIEKLNTKIEKLETSINSLRNIEIESAIDFGALENISKNMPCATCTTQGEAFAQLREIVKSMRDRREERKKLINQAMELGVQ